MSPTDGSDGAIVIVKARLDVSGVPLGVSVAVGVGVAVGLGIGVGVGVDVDVGVAVGVGVGDGVVTDVGVGVGIGVASGCVQAPSMSMLSIKVRESCDIRCMGISSPGR